MAQLLAMLKGVGGRIVHNSIGGREHGFGNDLMAESACGSAYLASLGRGKGKKHHRPCQVHFS